MKISLRAARNNCNMSADNVSAILGISKTTLYNWERGETSPQIKYIEKLSHLYNIPIHSFFLESNVAKNCNDDYSYE